MNMERAKEALEKTQANASASMDGDLDAEAEEELARARATAARSTHDSRIKSSWGVRASRPPFGVGSGSSPTRWRTSTQGV